MNNKILKVWKLHYDELIGLIGTKKKLQTVIAEKLKTLEEDWDQALDNVILQQQESLDFKIDNNIYGQNRKLVSLLKTVLNITDIKDVNKSRDTIKVYSCIAQATNIKFRYSENAKGPGGSKEALGSIYGNIDDGTGYTAAIFPTRLYKQRKQEVESMKGEVCIFFVTRQQRGGSVVVKDFVLLKNIAKGNPKNLAVKVVGGLDESFDPKAFREEVRSCEKCDLRKGCRSPVAPNFGRFNILILGEAPGGDEDKEGKGFIGSAGQKLWSELAKVNIKREDCIVSNCVNCRPPKNKLPNILYAVRCPWTTKLIDRLKPRFILALGNVPLYYFRRQAKGIMALSGKTEWNNRAEAWVTYCVHPASVLYHADNIKLFKKGIESFAKVIRRFA